LNNIKSISEKKSTTLNFFLGGKNIPIIITIIFFFAMFYVAFFHNTLWHEQDGMWYMYQGKDFFNGNSQNSQLIGAPIGAPIIYSVLENYFGNPFEIQKSISLISGTVIVIISYFIVKNIFGPKIALVSQILIAINPKLQFLSISALNELMPIALIISSFYFLTKNELKNSHFVFIGILLGLSFMIRYQSIFIVLGIFIFLLIRNRKISKNMIQAGILILIFVLVSSPMLIFNYTTYGEMIENDTSFYFLALFQSQTPEWRETVQEMKEEGIISLVLLDHTIFVENYFFNLFTNNPNKLFNFGSLDNISILPVIPIIGFVTVVLGFLHCIQIARDYRIWVAIIALIVSTLSVLFIGNITQHYFAIFLIPLIILGILSRDKMNKNFLPLLIISIVFFFSLSILPVYRSYQFLPLLIPFSILNSIFIVEIVSKISYKQKFLEGKNLEI
jgi:4-amino-4-deoxy-L-arabinose transferase-like glycosyltransferase